MHHRMKVMVLGAAALALIGTGAVANIGVFAQESTPEAESTPAVGSTGETETSAYDEFVAALAANLGISDPATVDTAIKETLKQKVDEQLAAGEISANEATARKERIDAGEFGGFFLGRGGSRDGGPRVGGHDRQGGDDSGKQDDGTDSGSDDTESLTPTPPASS
jgi:hypothetical protein